MLRFDAITGLLAFGKDQAGTLLALVGVVLVILVVAALLLRASGWKP
jgi:hypothetical protein